MEIIKSETVGNRADLARLCNTKHLKRAVEIGTDRGSFAAEFLSRWDGEMFYCVDPYSPYLEMPWDRTGDFLLALEVLKHEARRIRFVRANSLEVAHYFGTVDGWPKEIDFVYIDGAHDFDSINQDIRAWWPIVRAGGILAGDDFDKDHPGVVKAVLTFATEFDLRVDLTTDYNRGPSWYIEKW